MLDSDGLFSGACPSCSARITRVAQCPECDAVFGPPQVAISPEDQAPGPAFYGTPPADRTIADEMGNGGTRPGEPPGREFPSPPTPTRVSLPPANRPAPATARETLPEPIELAAAHRVESPFTSRPTDPEPGDHAQPGDDS